MSDAFAEIQNQLRAIQSELNTFRTASFGRTAIADEEINRINRMEIMCQLSGGIAHDFNNILSGILSNIALARLRVKPQDGVDTYLNHAEKATLKAAYLAQQLQIFAEGGTPVRQVTDIVNLVQESAEFILLGSNCRAQFEIAPDLFVVEVDQIQFNQAISNIIMNADQAMPAGGLITIQLSNFILSDQASSLPLPTGYYLRIAIQDQGVGIPKSIQENIFDPYFSTKPNGRGLGLSIAYAVIKKHGGLITFESQPGLGTMFVIYLPAAEKHSSEQAVNSEAVLATGNARILVLEDNALFAEALKDMLEALGYTPEIVQEGYEMVTLYQQRLNTESAFHCALVDMTIPGGMGGLKTAERILEFDPYARLIATSGYQFTEVMDDFKKFGFQAFIRKPYTIQQLAQVINEVLN